MTQTNSGERQAVRRLLRHLTANGFRVVGVYDGESMHRDAVAKGEDGILDIVFNLDESSIRVMTGERQPIKNAHGIYIVLGNAPDGSEVVADWNFYKDDSDGFDAVMDAFLESESAREGARP